MFADDELRQQVQKLLPRLQTDGSDAPAAKRQKADDGDPSLLIELAAQVCQLVDANLDSQMDELESRILFVYPLTPDVYLLEADSP